MKKASSFEELKNLVNPDLLAEEKINKPKKTKEMKETKEEKKTNKKETTTSLVLKVTGKVQRSTISNGFVFIAEETKVPLAINPNFFRLYDLKPNVKIVGIVKTEQGVINNNSTLESFELPNLELTNVQGIVSFSGIESSVDFVSRRVTNTAVVEITINDYPNAVFQVNPDTIQGSMFCNTEGNPRKAIVSVVNGEITNLYFQYPDTLALAYTFRLESNTPVYESTTFVNITGVDVDFQTPYINVSVGTENNVPYRLVNNNGKVTVLIAVIANKPKEEINFTMPSPEEYIELITSFLTGREEIISAKG